MSLSVRDLFNVLYNCISGSGRTTFRIGQPFPVYSQAVTYSWRLIRPAVSRNELVTGGGLGGRFFPAAASWVIP